MLETRDARVLLTDAGRYRFEAGRAPDTTSVTVFQGGAHVDAGGTIIAVRPGRRAEVGFGGTIQLWGWGGGGGPRRGGGGGGGGRPGGGRGAGPAPPPRGRPATGGAPG